VRSHISRNSNTFNIVALFVTVTILTTLVSLAQMPTSSPASSIAHARPRSPSLGSADAQLAPVISGRKQESGVGPLDSGYPLFLPVVNYGWGPAPYGAASVAIADLNGDGKPDVVVASLCANSACSAGAVSVLMGNGDGTFQPAVAYVAGDAGGTMSVVVADVNGDGKLDVVVGNYYDDSIGVLLGNGDGTFQPVLTYASGSTDITISVAVSDVNGDGKPDILAAVNNCGEGYPCRGLVSVLLGNGDGTFQPAVTYSSGGNYIASVAIADVNGDGKPDVIAANLCSDFMPCSGSGSVGVLLGNGDGTFQPAVTYSSGGNYLNYFNSQAVAIGDLNGDGKLDIVVTDPYGGPVNDGAVGVLLGNGDGTFQPVVIYDSGGSTLSAVTVGDVNEDGKLDVIVANECPTGNGCAEGSVGVLLGNGDGTFQPVVTFSAPQGIRSVAVGDVNGDGRPDAVIPSNIGSAGALGVFLNDTGPHSPSATTLVSNTNPVGLNQTVTYTATVMVQSSTAPMRTVSFQEGGATVATVQVVNGQAAYSTSYAKRSAQAITATYSGDTANAASTSAPLTEYVEPLPVSSKAALSTSGSPSLRGQLVTFTATVTARYGTIPDGQTVTFSDDGAVIGTGNTASGVATFTTSSLTVKTHYIGAAYGGNGTFTASSSTVEQVVDKDTTTTALVSGTNPSAYGQAVTFTATVTASEQETPTGKVEFKDGTDAIGSVTMSGGVAVLTEAKLKMGSHSITAEYEGDAGSVKSISNVVIQVVK
jgi:Bacterial Ig-like domain (group 3)/FG-GAP-like repeat